MLFAGKERVDGLKYNIKGLGVHRGTGQFYLDTFVPHRNCYEELVGRLKPIGNREIF